LCVFYIEDILIILLKYQEAKQHKFIYY